MPLKDILLRQPLYKDGDEIYDATDELLAEGTNAIGLLGMKTPVPPAPVKIRKKRRKRRAK